MKRLAKVKDLAYAKFDESVDVSINFGIDATKGEQVVRGSVLLPHGTGKKARVIVFAKGDYADASCKKQEQIMLAPKILLKRLKMVGWILILRLRLLILWDQLVSWLNSWVHVGYCRIKRLVP